MRIIHDRSGASGIEFALTAPIVALLFLGAITVFDLYRSYWQVVQATYIVSDVVTRETAIDTAYVDRIYGIYTNLFSTASAPKALRISSLQKVSGSFVVKWSETRGDTSIVTKQVITPTQFPNVADSDSIIYVEGFTVRKAASGILGFLDMKFHQQTYARPRFISAIALTKS
jgi:Flp pilus assembly protein TadG